MKFDHQSLCRQIDRLRRALPAYGHPKTALLAELPMRGVTGRAAPRLSVIDIFDASGVGVLCRFLVAGQGQRSFIAPLSQIFLDRRHPLGPAVAACGCAPRPRAS